MEVSQKRFLLKNGAGDTALTYTVPFTYTTSKEPNFDKFETTFLPNTTDVQKIILSDKTDWVIANIQQVGYYRVNYDDETWHGIHHALLSPNNGNIHDVNRAQIVDDLMNLGRSGEISYNLVLDVLDYLKIETNYLPWTAAFNGFSFIAERIEKDSQTVFGTYVLSLIDRVYKKLGFKDQSGSDSRLDIYNRPKVLAWACKYGNEDCKKTATEMFTKMVEEKTPVPVNIRSAVYCSAIREGTADDYEHLRTIYEKSTVPTEQVLILAALGCVKTEELITKQYEYILSSEVRPQDRLSSLSALISQNHGNALTVFNLIEKDFATLDTKYA